MKSKLHCIFGLAVILTMLNSCLATTPNQATLSLAEAPIPANGLGPLTGKVFGSGKEVLLLILHGDVSGGNAPADYIYDFAQQMSRRQRDEATVVALLRPGYFDSEGRQSPGTNHDRWDQYTEQNNKAVADTIRNLKSAMQPKRVVVMGHSGGAAQLGSILGQYPDLIDGALLVSCPCDLVKWRSGRNRQFVRSQSPIDFVTNVSKATRVVAVTGEKDENTKPELATEYVDALKDNGIDATVDIVPGAGHHRLSSMQTAIQQAISLLSRE